MGEAERKQRDSLGAHEAERRRMGARRSPNGRPTKPVGSRPSGPTKPPVCSDDQRWQRLTELREIKQSDLPFPRISFRGLSRGEFNKLAKRWHPDKFAQAFGSKLC